MQPWAGLGPELFCELFCTYFSCITGLNVVLVYIFVQELSLNKRDATVEGESRERALWRLIGIRSSEVNSELHVVCIPASSSEKTKKSNDTPIAVAHIAPRSYSDEADTG